MRPAQLLRQCRNNFFVGEGLGKLHHTREVCRIETPAELSNQFLRQRGKNLPTVLRTFISKNIMSNSIAHPPIEERQSRVHDRRRVAAGIGDQLAQLGDQPFGALRTDCNLGHTLTSKVPQSFHTWRHCYINRELYMG